jgi:phytanoyl-CoA hydroxylase
MDIQLHPWNKEFEWVPGPGLGGVLTADEIRQFDEVGFVVVDDVLDADTVANTLAEIDAIEAENEEGLRTRKNERFGIAEAGAITFTTHLVSRSPALRSLSAAPVFAGLCADLVGPDVNLYWDQAVYKKPEKPRRFPWHQDNGYAYVEPQKYLTCWVALTDATLDNGCPQVAPGLHLKGTLRHEYVHPLCFECISDYPDASVAEVKAGGAVVFSSLTPHLTGPNITDGVRKAYILQYAPEGAAVLQGDPAEGPPTAEAPANEPSRQFPVLRDGKRVEQ